MTKYKPIKNALSMLLVVIGMTNLQAQQELPITVAPNVKVPSDFTPDIQRKCVQAAEGLLVKYQEYGAMLDRDKNEVNSKSITRFKGLFSGASEVYEDYYQFPPADLVEPGVYGEVVFNFLQENGLRFLLEDPVLRKIEFDPRGFYDMEVAINKKIFNYLDAQKYEQDAPAGLMRELIMIISVPVNDPTTAKIFKIEQRGGCAAEDFTTYYGIALTGGFALVQPAMSDHWKASHENSVFDVKGKPAVGIQAFWLSNRLSQRKACSKKWFVSAGIGIQRLSWEVNLDQYYVKDFKDTDTPVFGIEDGNAEFWRITGPVKGTQTDQLWVVEAPLGINYRLMKKNKSAAYLNVGILGGMGIISSSEFQGSGTYDGYFTKPNVESIPYRILEEKATNPSVYEEGLAKGYIGENIEIDEVVGGDGIIQTELKSKFYFGLTLGLTGYWEIPNNNPTWGFMAGIQYNLPLSSMIATSNITQDKDDVLGIPQQISEDKKPINNSLVHSYMTAVKIGLPAIRFGVFYKIAKAP